MRPQPAGPLSVALAVCVAAGMIDQDSAERAVASLSGKVPPVSFAAVVAEIQAALDQR